MASLYQVVFTALAGGTVLLRPMKICFGRGYMMLYKVRHSTKNGPFSDGCPYKGVLRTRRWNKIRYLFLLKPSHLSQMPEMNMNTKIAMLHPLAGFKSSPLSSESLQVLSFAFSGFLSLSKPSPVCRINPCTKSFL